MTMAKLIHFRAEARSVLEPLFTSNFGQKILPYFDPDISVITDSYATSVLDLGKYDRSRAGMYCLMTQVKDKLEDLVWSTRDDNFHVNGKPYTTLAAENDNNCYWKLVPHGNHLFSIVNKKGCDATPPAKWCGSLLSFDIIDDTGIVNIEPTDGVMWEIHGYQWNMIRSKWGCSGSSPNSYCDRELRVQWRTKMVYFDGFRMPPRQISKKVGKVLPSDGKYYWVLRKV
ncbi:hypothetical protein AC249_AIPGENE19225 [Exaiptasia diaphana]|nr:hypothetical protein AC249_AIPGENE19225 [Exaiptasia diaphana]